MSVMEEHIKRVNTKIQQLLKQYQSLQKINTQLSDEVKMLKASHETDLIRTTQLEQQVIILRSAAGQMSDSDKKSFEKIINQYVREIDKCIGLLSE
ncbi:MAG: hypothetical protein ABIN67_05430 [Ferruginibacter sp.]